MNDSREPHKLPPIEKIELLAGVVAQLIKRIDLLESVFKKMMEFDMRLDTLEFNSDLPVKPGISEKLATLEFKINSLMEFINNEEIVNE